MNGDRDTDMTIPEYQSSGLTGPARVGAELRGVRERLGWKLPDLAARLKIRLPFLEAIEAGNLATLPAPAYAAGFIRSYADSLGLDSNEILRRFRAEGLTKPAQPTFTFPEPVPDRAVPPGAIVFLVAVIGIGAYFLWYRHSEHELKMAQMVPAVPAKLAPLAMPKPPPAKSKPESAPKVSAATPPTASGGAVPALPADTTSGAPPPGNAAANAVLLSAIPGHLIPPPAPLAASSVASGARLTTNPLVISATADSWVQVQGTNGTILFSRVLKAGESWPVPDEPGLTLTTGNAGGTVLIRDGVTGAPLGPAGSVLRKMPLTKPAPTGSDGTPATAPATSAPSPAP
ncbi:MAG: DUF4115 domain-containing protein [Acidiphilium sp.]|nr:DUF4115 domain-containing protein [Acidiphilium sp.]